MWRKLGIEPGEGRIFVSGAVALFLLGWTDVSVKNVSEAVFLKRVGVGQLPLAFLVNSVLLVASTWAVGRLAGRTDRLRLLPLTGLALAVLLLPIWVMVRYDVYGGPALLILASKQITSIALLVFWISMGDLLHGRQAKRLFAPMMGGVTLGTILGSFASEPIAIELGVDGLVPVSAGTLVLFSAATLPLRRLRPRLEVGVGRGAVPQAEEEPEGALGELAGLWRESRLFRLLLVVAGCSGLLGPMLYFQFQWVANQATAGEENLLAFYATFRGWLGGAVLLAQVLLVRTLYRRIGVPLSTALSPIIYLAGFLGLSTRMSLGAGIGAMAGTKVQDNAVYDPALRVLYNVFPEALRSRASALLEGPVKRGGGAFGNGLAFFSNMFGSAQWVGFLAIPITFVWLAVSLVLWRRYPRLLLEATTAGGRGALEDRELLDPSTLKALAPELCSDDPARCRIAVDLVSMAEPELAVASLARAARDAPPASRPLMIAALDRLLENAIIEPPHNLEAAGWVEELMAAPDGLGPRDRADLVQAYGRLITEGGSTAPLERSLADPEPAVRLAALAALHRREAAPPDLPDLDEALEAAVVGDDPAARRTAREEYRALLLGGNDECWERRLHDLADVIDRGEDLPELIEALAQVAERHGERTHPVAERLMAWREERDPRVRRALVRFAGHSGLEDQMDWVIEHLGTDEASDAAAREALVAYGAGCSEMLLRELSFGKRSKRESILEVMRELDTPPETLRAHYESLLDGIEEDLRRGLTLRGLPVYDLLRQRLEERVREDLHTALLFLAAIRHESRIAELSGRLRSSSGARRHAILIEALESLLPSAEQNRLLPLLEGHDLYESSGPAAGSPGEVIHDMLEDPEELARSIANGVAVAAGIEVEDHDGVDSVEKMLHIQRLSLFEGLTTRQLMDLAEVVREQVIPAGEVVVQQGEYDDCLYLVVEGVIHIKRGDTLLAEMGPGDFFGEIALFEGTARSATAVTQAQTRLLSLERGDLMNLIDELPGIAVGLIQTLSRRVRELTDRLMV